MRSEYSHRLGISFKKVSRGKEKLGIHLKEHNSNIASNILDPATDVDATPIPATAVDDTVRPGIRAANTKETEQKVNNKTNNTKKGIHYENPKTK